MVDASGKVNTYRFNLPLAVASSFGLGFISRLLGIGGGPIQVPLLTAFFGLPAHIATATSLFVLMVTASALLSRRVAGHGIIRLLAIALAGVGIRLLL